jgi:hypothetical protein
MPALRNPAIVFALICVASGTSIMAPNARAMPPLPPGVCAAPQAAMDSARGRASYRKVMRGGSGAAAPPWIISEHIMVRTVSTIGPKRCATGPATAMPAHNVRTR